MCSYKTVSHYYLRVLVIRKFETADKFLTFNAVKTVGARVYS